MHMLRNDKPSLGSASSRLYTELALDELLDRELASNPSNNRVCKPRKIYMGLLYWVLPTWGKNILGQIVTLFNQVCPHFK